MYGHLKMATMWLKEKRLELTGQLEYNGFHISQLYGAHVHQEKVYKVLQLVQSRKICDASRHDKEENEAWNRRYKFRDPGPYRDQFSKLGPYWVLIFSRYTYIFKSTRINTKMGLKLMIIETIHCPTHSKSFK